MSDTPLLTRVNGKPGMQVATTDRGLLYGDGIFETISVHAGKPRFWPRHMARLQTGCHRLGISRVDLAQLRSEVDELLQVAAPTGSLILKLIITRGVGQRGYWPDPDAQPTRILQLFEWPPGGADQDGIRATLCTLRLGNNPQLAGIKHLNRLEQVLARGEWDDPDIDEGLLLDQEGRVIEGTMSNLFLVKDGLLQTPDLTRCGVAGIMRAVILDRAMAAGIETRVCDLQLDDLYQADELFVCNSLFGIRPILAVNSNRYPHGDITRQLQFQLHDYDDDEHSWRA